MSCYKVSVQMKEPAVSALGVVVTTETLGILEQGGSACFSGTFYANSAREAAAKAYKYVTGNSAVPLIYRTEDPDQEPNVQHSTWRVGRGDDWDVRMLVEFKYNNERPY